MRVLLCDDHRLFAEALGMVLAGAGWDVVAAVERAERVVEAAGHERPDLCLVDMSFPDGWGLDLVAPILAASPGTKVVILSASADRDSMAAALEAGASGYLSKSDEVGSIVARLQRVVDGEIVLHGRPGVATTLTARRSPERLLTRRELEVLRCLCNGHSTGALAGQLGITQATARSHVQNVLRKLGVHSQLQAVAYANSHAGAA